jgi:acyl transferase domain-containing protein
VTKPPVVFLFGGQGSQHFQMARELYDCQPRFRECLERYNERVEGLTGKSVVAELYADRRNRTDLFDRILFTHPAILMVELALAETLQLSSLQPDYVLGASLGSFAAAVVAGALTAEEALRAVVAEAVLLDGACPKGAMIAILADIDIHQREPLLRECEIAAVNSPGHFVVACPSRQAAGVEQRLRDLNIAHLRLPATYAFHSRWIDPLKDGLSACASTLSPRKPRIPLVCCASGDVIEALPQDYFWSVARRPIRFDRAIETLEMRGACRYIDLSPAGSLAAMLKYALPRTSTSTSEPILGYFGGDLSNLEAVTSRSVTTGAVS